jgi:hypothetical protein
MHPVFIDTRLRQLLFSKEVCVWEFFRDLRTPLTYSLPAECSSLETK